MKSKNRPGGFQTVITGNRRRWLSTLAAAAMVAIILLHWSSTTESEALSGPAFEPEPSLEEWTHEKTCTQTDKVQAVLSPVNGTVIGDKDVTFQWQMSEKISHVLKVVDNTNEQVLASTLDLSQFPQYTVRVNTESLTGPGLYYWRLEDAYEVLYVGKFYIPADL